jgi:N-acetylmuramoyl-L-alanine amidase
MASTTLRVIVTQGHRNTSGGNPSEAARTPALANAIAAALTRAGHAAACLQNDDGTADNWFAGSLDAVARKVMAYHRERPVDLLLDVHLESDPANTPGVFAIVPDGRGLKSLTAYAGEDRAIPASRDYRVARSIARAVARTTGLALRTRGVLEPGVMSEQATRVGGDLGWRLAMFGYTAPARERMTRIVLECGNLGADAAIINDPGFPERVAEGVVAGIAAGWESTPPAFPPFGTRGDLEEVRLVTVTVPTLRVRRFAETGQAVLARLAQGSEIPVTGWIIGEEVEGNPVWWLAGSGGRSDPRWRVWSGGTDLAGPDVLRLPTLE